MRYIWLTLAVLALSHAVQAQTLTVGIFVSDDQEPIVSDDVVVTCGPTVVGAGLSLMTAANDRLCFADLSELAEGLAPGRYRVAVLDAGAWGERGLPIVVTEPKTCIDPLTSTTFALSAGPPVQVMPNSTVAQRAAWLARERQLMAAGFDVRMLLVSTSVYVAATCR
jgi:hypothetical protein